jgi:hypothetical protein
VDGFLGHDGDDADRRHKEDDDLFKYRVYIKAGNEHFKKQLLKL